MLAAGRQCGFCIFESFYSFSTVKIGALCRTHSKLKD